VPNEDVYGVFCDNLTVAEQAEAGSHRCESWNTNYKKTAFETRIKEFSNLIDKIYSDESLTNEGKSLFNVLASNKKDGYFTKFLDRIIDIPVQGRKPSFFIKADISWASSLLIPPISLAVVSKSDTDYFLGDLFRIETPLPIPSYATEKSCITQWRAFFPLHKDLVSSMTQTALATWKDRSYVPKNGTKYQISSLSDYLTQPADKVPEALVFVGHQASNRLYFEDIEEGVSESDFKWKYYSAPSMAILSGCNTASPGSSDIISRLNKNGMDSIIATNSTISEHMAGAFLSCFEERYQNAGKKSYLYQLYDETIDCLSKTMNNNGNAIGHLALKYMLLGNGYIELCKSN